MNARIHPPSKDRKSVGQVVFLSEKMAIAREISSCCVGTEAALETNSGFGKLIGRLISRDGIPDSSFN